MAVVLRTKSDCLTMYAVTWLWTDSSEGESNLTKLATAAKIHGVFSSLFPMKKSKTCSYFDGAVTDGKVSMRVFGLNSKSLQEACGVRGDHESCCHLQLRGEALTNGQTVDPTVRHS